MSSILWQYSPEWLRELWGLTAFPIPRTIDLTEPDWEALELEHSDGEMVE